MSKTYSYRPERSVLNDIEEFVDEHPDVICGAMRSVSLVTTLSSLTLALSDSLSSFSIYLGSSCTPLADDHLATKVLRLLSRNALQVNKTLLIAFVLFVLSTRAKDVVALIKENKEEAKPTVTTALTLIFNNIVLGML